MSPHVFEGMPMLRRVKFCNSSRHMISTSMLRPTRFIINLQLSTTLLFPSSSYPCKTTRLFLFSKAIISKASVINFSSANHDALSTTKTVKTGLIRGAAEFIQTPLFVGPGVDPNEVTDKMVLPGSNIVAGPYAGDAKIKEIEFIKSSDRPKDCPKDGRPEFTLLGRSNVGKSSLINALVRKKEVALTSKTPGKTQLINHFLVNKSWYLVDLPGYGFAKASGAARMDWSSFTKGFFLSRETLVSVLLLIDASVPPQKIDLDCANWLGRNNQPMTFVFTKCDKRKGDKENRPDRNIRTMLELIRGNYRQHPPWIMTSSVTGLGRDELLLHLSQLRNYWDVEE